MNQHSLDDVFGAAGGLITFIIGLFVLFVIACWVIFPVLMSSRIGEVLKALQRQNDLLEQITRNTRPAAPSGEPAKSAGSFNYMKDERKSSTGTVLVILGAVFVVLLVVALASKK